jgi:hypothetical protein
LPRSQYYNSINTLHEQQQQPLWCSPPATPAKACQKHQHMLSTRRNSHPLLESGRTTSASRAEATSSATTPLIRPPPLRVPTNVSIPIRRFFTTLATSATGPRTLLHHTRRNIAPLPTAARLGLLLGYRRLPFTRPHPLPLAATIRAHSHVRALRKKSVRRLSPHWPNYVFPLLPQSPGSSTLSVSCPHAMSEGGSTNLHVFDIPVCLRRMSKRFCDCPHHPTVTGPSGSHHRVPMNRSLLSTCRIAVRRRQ